MKKYVWGRKSNSLHLSKIVIAMVMIYTLIPRHLIFKTGPNISEVRW